MAIFSSRVIWASTWLARASGGAVEPTHGQSARGTVAADAVAADVRVDATTANARAATTGENISRRTISHPCPNSNETRAGPPGPARPGASAVGFEFVDARGA